MNLQKIANVLDLIADQWPTTPSGDTSPPSPEDTQTPLIESLGARYTPELGEKIAADPDLLSLILEKHAASAAPRPFGTPVDQPNPPPASLKDARKQAMADWGDNLHELARR